MSICSCDLALVVKGLNPLTSPSTVTEPRESAFKIKKKKHIETAEAKTPMPVTNLKKSLKKRVLNFKLHAEWNI